MSATSGGGGGSVSEGSEAGGSTQSTMSVSDSPSTSFQTNLTENVTKITLSEENIPGGFGADVTGSKINLSLDDRQQEKEGIVNVAFDYEEGANRGSAGGGGESGGADFRSINGAEKKDKVPEAVNLELVNMVPYSNGNGTSYGVPVNGIPMKKDSEQVDMSTPYDEYFVPVNEHKKYMRGEKLYVTKDKRRPTSWRRCLSWIVACTVISVVLILAILAGTGVILSQEPNLVKESSVGRNFAASNPIKPSVTNKSPAPTAEMYMYVPRSIESEFVIDNLDFDPAFMDINSTTYQQFAANMEHKLKMLLFDKKTLEVKTSDIGLRVVNISRDPFTINYRIGWNFKQGVNNPPEPIKMEDVKKILVESLNRNQGYIDKYHIDREAIKVNHVVNICQMNNGGCSHICYYNYNTQHFACTCPTHLVLDSSGKNCVEWTGSSEDDALPVPSQTAYPGMPYESTVNPVEEEEIGARYEHGLHHHHDNQYEDGSAPSPETEPKGDEEEEHEPAAEPAPEPTDEPSPDGKDAVNDEESVHSLHDIDLKAAPELTSEPDAKNKYGHSDHGNSDHVIHYMSESPAAEIEPTAKQYPSSGDLAAHFVHGYKAHEPSAESKPEPVSQATGNKNSEGRSHNHEDHSLYRFNDHEPAAKPAPEPVSEPTAEPSSEGKDHYGHSQYGSKDDDYSAEPTPEPTAEPNSEVKDHDHVVFVSKGHEAEPTAEPAPEPTVTGDSAAEDHDHGYHSVSGSKDNEPSEAVPEPTAADDSNPKSHDHEISVISDSKDEETAAEPTPEPAPEFTTTGDSNAKNDNHADHSASGSKDYEPANELTPQPTALDDSNAKDYDHVIHVISDSKDEKTVAEPTPEAAPEFTTTGDSNTNNDNHAGYSAFGFEDREYHGKTAPSPVAESDSSEKNHETMQVFKGSGPEIEPTTKSSSEGSSNDHDAYSEVESKDQEPTLEPGSDLKVQSKLHSGQIDRQESQLKSKAETNEPEPTPQSSEGDTNSGSSEQSGTTIHPLATKEHTNSGQVVPSQEEMRRTESRTEHKTGVQPTVENESTHHTPHLEDILIRKQGSENQNRTGQNPLDNIELMENGKPVIEEVIIDNSGRQSNDQSGFSSIMLGHLGNESHPTSPTRDRDRGIPIADTNDSSTKDDQDLGAQSKIGGSADHPKIVEYGAVQFSTQDKVNMSEAEKSGSETVATPDREPSTKGTDQDSHRSIENLSLGGDVFGFRQMHQAHQPLNSSQDIMSVTTGHPEIQQEHHTLPVIVELLSPANAIPEMKTKEGEGHTDVPAISIREEFHASVEEPGKNNSGVLAGKERPGIKEGEYMSMSALSDGQIHDGNRTRVHETTTEQQVAMTTLLTILTPEGVEKITGQLISEKDMVPKEIEVENKTMNIGQSQEGLNETAKSHGDISNNIKDELSENEEFNTLIEEEYKNKEGNLSEGKEIINKYPNKLLKTEKKKVKDYVKGEKIESEKKGEVTAEPAVTPEDFILQKHVNGNENIYDLDYSLQNEHTTKHDGEVTVTDPHAIDGIPGLSFKPHGINNHDISVLQTVAPDFRTETFFPTAVQELETLKPETKSKFSESKEGEFKTDKDYPKFDKDYKYEKQKVSKKKELKKKVGGKDGKNVELDDGRKYFTEVSREDLDVSKEITETTMNPSYEKNTIQLETKTESDVEVTTVSGQLRADGTEATVQPTWTVEMGTEAIYDHTVRVIGLLGIKSPNAERNKPSEQSISVNTSGQIPKTASVSQKGNLTIEEPTVKSTSSVSSINVYDGQLSGIMGPDNLDMTQAITNSTSGGQGTTGIEFDEIPLGITASGQMGMEQMSGRDGTLMVHHTLPKVISDRKSESGTVNATAAHPTIIIHGQSGSLQDGHMLRFANSTFLNPGNVTVGSMFNETFIYPDGHAFSFSNYTATFPNGSTMHPTIVVRGQSGTLQDGHQSRFGNATYQSLVTSSIHPTVFQNSNVYRIENETLPGTVFDGNFNSQNGHYHMYTNSSGTFVYTNASAQPSFIIRGESGDFGNSTAYIIRNNTRTFSGGFVGPESVIFRNSTVFAVESDTPGTREITVQPHKVTSNETIHFTNQVSPSFVSSGTAYKVNDYFGYVSKCAAGQFQCVNGTSKRGSACINLSSKCDSVPDCSDGSDELGCIANGCPGNFQCSDGTCLRRNLVCNGILDCSDESDEKNCKNWKCEFDEFQCPSGRCIPVVWQCDGKPDCENHTDEYNCQTSCGNDEYLCPEGWCIPLTYKCNGVRECSNGEDEQLCDCSHEEFKCHTGGCVSLKHVCDGLEDCPDRSDEWDCVKLEPESNLLKIRSASGDYLPVCGDRWLPRFSEEVCTSLGYFSSVPIENKNSSSIMTESSFYVLKNDTTVNFNKKIIVNLIKGDRNCASGKMVEISCQEFSCGSRSMTDSGSVEARLVGGMNAASGQWPSVALLDNVRNLHSCTANVLTPRWVLASYNCLKMGNKNLNEQDWEFYGGSTVFETEKENAETRKILRIIPHPQLKFNQFLFTNDLALVELDQSLQFTSSLGAVCLPEQEIQPRQICVTAGWGMNVPEEKVIRQQLQYLPVPTMNLTECNSTEHYSGFITHDKICAGYNSAQKSLCYNEEGAPLMCVNDRGEWELQGVLSYHSNCGRGSHPSIFSSIMPVSDWIKKTVGNIFERKDSPVTKR